MSCSQKRPVSLLPWGGSAKLRGLAKARGTRVELGERPSLALPSTWRGLSIQACPKRGQEWRGYTHAAGPLAWTSWCSASEITVFSRHKAQG